MNSYRFLIIGPAWVGDMVMAQCLFQILKTQNPHCTIDVLAPDWTRPLLERMPEVNQALSLPFKHGELNLRARFHLARALKNKYDHAIVLPNSWKSALIPFFAGIKKRTGWRGEMRFGLLNDVRYLNKEKLPLMIERFMALGLNPTDALPKPLPRPTLIINETTRKNTIEKYQIDLNKKILVLCPGAEFGPSKKWPANYYAQVAQHYLQQNWQVWILGSPKDQIEGSMIQQITQQQCRDFTGKTSLSEAIDLLSLANLVISNDSGLMHIAAALNRKLVAIYGSSSPKFTPPLSDDVKIISLGIECSPCFQRVCPLKHHHCMIQLTPENILGMLNQ